MPDGSSTRLEALIARRRPGYTLEAPFYTSAALFDLDMDIIFGRHWIYVGVEPDIAEPGDCLTVEIGKDSVVILRDDDGALRAFHNVCRHRGARLVHEQRTNVGNLVCRYHQWTYGLDGGLRFAEHMGAGFDTSCHSLKPVHLRSLAGLLFICLAAEPPADFEATAAALEPYVAPHDLRNAKIVKEMTLVERGNWKLVMENNRECYHCLGSHPELTQSLFEYGFGFAPESLDDISREQLCRYDAMVAADHARWEAAGLASREIEHLADCVTGFRAQRLPLDRAGESQTLDARAACNKLLGQFTDRRLGGLSVWTQPNSWHHFMSDHIVTFSVLPLDAEHTLVRTKWLVHKEAVEGVDYDVAKLTEVWEATNQQDAELVAMSQAGARSGGYEPGPYSTHTEGFVEKFTAWYAGRLAAHVTP